MFKPGKKQKGFYQSYPWKKLRKEHLAIEPLCRMCDERGKVIIANTVDHIVPRSHGGADAHYNLQSLCRQCHDKKRNAEGLEAKSGGPRF
jgi:5-methylcytosine-specific restriction protein A